MPISLGAKEHSRIKGSVSENNGEFIRWLQISDIHIGSDVHKWTDENLQAAFIDLLNDTNNRFDFIIISGDLIHKAEYGDHRNIKQLQKLLKGLLKLSEHIIIAPGNHDCKRDDTRQRILLDDWKTKSKDEKNSAAATIAQKLRGDFEPIEKIIREIDSRIIFAKKMKAVVVESGINVIVLNTSTFSGQPAIDNNGKVKKTEDGSYLIEDDGYIFVSEDEYIQRTELDQKYPTIMVGHHTLEMFEEASKNAIEDFAYQCDVLGFFCGHVHSSSKRTNKKVDEYVSGGLFNDDYNAPCFSTYSIKKSRNETIKTQNFRWSGKDWVISDEKEHTEELTPHKEQFDSQMNNMEYVIPPSENSDGAARLPYGSGFLNVYISKDQPNSITIPHIHESTDEITYVMKGRIIAYVNDRCLLVDEGDFFIMPKGLFHGFLPATYPSECITISYEEKERTNNEWDKDLDKLKSLDQKCDSDQKDIKDYQIIIDYLKSPIMEVTTRAESVLKKRLVREDCEDNRFIRAALGKEIELAIRSSTDVKDKFWALCTAYSLGIDIAEKDISRLMNNNENFMISWICAYYIIRHKRDIDIKKMINENFRKSESSDKDKVIRYYQRCVLSIIDLMVKHDRSSIQSKYDYFVTNSKALSTLPIEDLVFYFAMWYLSFTYNDEIIDFEKASGSFSKLYGCEGEVILRGLTNVQDYEERYKQMCVCKREGKLLESVYSYFESLELKKKRDNTTESMVIDKIQNYLRIIVSEECNLSCVYCHHEGRVDELIGLDIENNPEFDLRKLLNIAKKMQFKKIKISGGEPLLYPNIISICQEFNNDFDDIGFTTNATQIMRLSDELKKIRGTKLSFNVSLNTMNEESYRRITGKELLSQAIEGIEFLVDHGYSIKINSVITSMNFNEIDSLIAYAAKLKVNIKLLDLFTIESTPDDFKHVSISEIKNAIVKNYRLKDEDFKRKGDYLVANVMGIDVMIPSRIYSFDCQHNCSMYPCAEGIFGIRVYEDYSCAKCFNGTIHRGGINSLKANIEKIRQEMDMMRITY